MKRLHVLLFIASTFSLIPACLVAGVPLEKIARDLAAATDKVDIAYKAKELDSIAKTFPGHNRIFEKTFLDVESQTRTRRLENYFKAKARLGAGAQDFRDFSWDYVTKDLIFAKAKITTHDLLTLERIETESGFGASFNRQTPIVSGDIILIPLTAEDNGPLTVTALSKTGKTIAWTGNVTRAAAGADAPPIILNPTALGEGCEFYISSEPDKATVFFNDAKYYDETETTSVRDPGSWTVRLELEGYEDWEEKRTLESGDTWTINARMKKSGG